LVARGLEHKTSTRDIVIRTSKFKSANSPLAVRSVCHYVTDQNVNYFLRTIISICNLCNQLFLTINNY